MSFWYFISLFVVFSSNGHFGITVAYRTLVLSAAAKIFPLIRAIPVATSNPDASRMPFELIVLQRFPRSACGTRQSSALVIVCHPAEYMRRV